MNEPPKKERGLGGAALEPDWSKQEYHLAHRLQAFHRTVSTGEIRRTVLAQLTCAGGTRRKL
jgi:hypothetical protein